MKKIIIGALSLISIAAFCEQTKQLWDFESGASEWKASSSILLNMANSEESKIEDGALKATLPSKTKGNIYAPINGTLVYEKGFAGILFWARTSAPCTLVLSLESSNKKWRFNWNLEDSYWHEIAVPFNAFKEGKKAKRNLLSEKSITSVETFKIEVDNRSKKDMTLYLDAISLYGKIVRGPGKVVPQKDFTSFLTDYENGINASFSLGDGTGCHKEDKAVKNKSINVIKGKSGKVLRIEKNDSRDSLSYNTDGNIFKASGSIQFWVKLNWDSSGSGVKKASSSFVFFSGKWKNKTMIYFFRRKKSTSLNFMTAYSGKQASVCVNTTSWKKGSWHHVGATWNDGHAKVFINGVLVGTSKKFPDELQFGKQFYLGASIGTNKLGGELANFIISKYPQKIFPVIVNQ